MSDDLTKIGRLNSAGSRSDGLTNIFSPMMSLSLGQKWRKCGIGSRFSVEIHLAANGQTDTLLRFQSNEEASVAQLVELLICNQSVGGSNPFAGSVEQQCSAAYGRTAVLCCLLSSSSPLLLSDAATCCCDTRQEPHDTREVGEREEKTQGRLPEWLKGTDCKSVSIAYVGSNPTSPIGEHWLDCQTIGRRNV